MVFTTFSILLGYVCKKNKYNINVCIYILYRDDIVPGRTGSGGKTRGHRLRLRLERVDPLSWFRYTMVIVSYIELNVTKKINMNTPEKKGNRP